MARKDVGRRWGRRGKSTGKGEEWRSGSSYAVRRNTIVAVYTSHFTPRQHLHIPSIAWSRFDSMSLYQPSASVHSCVVSSQSTRSDSHVARCLCERGTRAIRSLKKSGGIKAPACGLTYALCCRGFFNLSQRTQRNAILHVAVGKNKHTLFATLHPTSSRQSTRRLNTRSSPTYRSPLRTFAKFDISTTLLLFRAYQRKKGSVFDSRCSSYDLVKLNLHHRHQSCRSHRPPFLPHFSLSHTAIVIRAHDRGITSDP